jgi:4,5:9,10-diseco-3-hydroxy-5,9,17-trioxoandrosta-1(10),2-diene-4-oate hydrolase
LQNSWRGKHFSWFEAGQGYPLILLHGGGGTGKAWWYQMEHFADHFRVLAPDMPGFGQSEWIADIDSVGKIPTAIRAWLEIWNIDHFVIGGNSMGGRVALSVACQIPEQVSLLILLDSVGVSLPDVPIVNPLTLPPNQFMAGLVRHPEKYRRITPYRTLSDAQELNRGRLVFASYLGAEGIAADPELNLSRASMPSLLIWGREDRIVPVEYGRALAQNLHDAELLIIDDTGHLPHIEEPGLTNGVISDFFRRHPAALTTP